ARVAASNATVLIRGESGVGKELVAGAIHHASVRRNGPMVCLNCAALSKDLLESELFGHEKGAFTGATDRKRGKFEQAHMGTLMLDEIGEMDLDLQAKLLRVLEGHAFERVGGQDPVHTDVRVIAATNRDLAKMVSQQQFRQDLFYRLHVVEIVVPPLRHRREDVLPLSQHFLSQLAEKMGRPQPILTPRAQKKLMAYQWPGNIRELRNVLERALVMSPAGSQPVRVDAEDVWLPSASLSMSHTEIDSETTSSGTAVPDHLEGNNEHSRDSEIPSLAELERRHIQWTLRQTGGNKSKASLLLGIERSTLDRKLKRYAKLSS
ncbi:MAG: sigma-54 dependent transcriptional regulator, partial [Planctomycetota bacterium]